MSIHYELLTLIVDVLNCCILAYFGCLPRIAFTCCLQWRRIQKGRFCSFLLLSLLCTF